LKNEEEKRKKILPKDESPRKRQITFHHTNKKNKAAKEGVVCLTRGEGKQVGLGGDHEGGLPAVGKA